MASNRGLAPKYLQCDCCDHYASALSKRGWCGKCEREFRDVVSNLRARRPLITIAEPAA